VSADMKITHVDVERIAETVRSGITGKHPAPFEGLFNDRTAAYESYIAGLRDSPITPDGLIYKEDGETKSLVVWLDPAPEAEDMDVAAVRIVGLFSAGSEEERAYYIVKLLDTLTTRLRQKEREYLLIDVNPAENVTIQVLEGSSFSLVVANDVFVGKSELDNGTLSLEPVNVGGEFHDFVSKAVPPVVDPYLGDFAVRAARRRFARFAEMGAVFYAVDDGTRIGALTLETAPGLPNDTVYIDLIHPWSDVRVYKAALTAGAKQAVVTVPYSEVKLRAELADIGFRPCDSRLTYRLIL
jgi:hypothetical protein